MPNYQMNYYTTGRQHTHIDAVAAIGAFLERYPNTMTIYERDVVDLGRDRQACNGWVIFDGAWSKINDSDHLHFADNIILN
jgi:hypothetical protein